MNNKLMEMIENEKNTMHNGFVCDHDYFVIIRNSYDNIKKWSEMGYDVTYDVICFNDIVNMNDFINGVATYDYIDNSCKLHDGEIILYHYMDGVNKYVDMKNIITALYNDFYINAINGHNGKNWKYQHLSNDVLHSLEYLHDEIIDNVIWKMFDENTENYGFGMLDKFNNYNHECFDKCVSRLRGEKYDHEHDTLISLFYENEFFTMFQYCIKNGISKNVAKSIKRHYEKINGEYYNHRWELIIVNKNYCTNYMDFEKSINCMGDEYFYKNGLCVSKF